MVGRRVLFAALAVACGHPIEEDPYAACYDADGDGSVGAHEAPVCTDGCEVACAMFSTVTWYCRNPATGEMRADENGFTCSTSSIAADHNGIRIVCDADGATPRCERVDGAALPSDLDRPQCLLGRDAAIDACGG